MSLSCKKYGIDGFPGRTGAPTAEAGTSVLKNTVIDWDPSEDMLAGVFSPAFLTGSAFLSVGDLDLTAESSDLCILESQRLGERPLSVSDEASSDRAKEWYLLRRRNALRRSRLIVLASKGRAGFLDRRKDSMLWGRKGLLWVVCKASPEHVPASLLRITNLLS